MSNQSNQIQYCISILNLVGDLKFLQPKDWTKYLSGHMLCYVLQYVVYHLSSPLFMYCLISPRFINVFLEKFMNSHGVLV